VNLFNIFTFRITNAFFIGPTYTINYWNKKGLVQFLYGFDDKKYWRTIGHTNIGSRVQDHIICLSSIEQVWKHEKDKRSSNTLVEDLKKGQPEVNSLDQKKRTPLEKMKRSSYYVEIARLRSSSKTHKTSSDFEDLQTLESPEGPKHHVDESLISYFYIIFDFVLFRFKFNLFKYYFLLDLFYFNCIFIFQERIFHRFSLGAKVRGLGAYSDWKIRDSAQKYITPQVRSLARPVPYLTRSCHIPELLFCCFCFLYKLPISLFLT